MALTKITGEGVGAVDNLTVDTNTLHVDAANNRVGVREASPAAPLHVSTAASTTAEIRLTSNNTGSGSGDRGRIAVYSSRNDGTAYEAGRIDIDRSSGTEDKAHIQFFTNDGSGASERLRILSGGGLTFNGDTAAANALNDYEEGTWTPSVRGSTTNGSFSGSNTVGFYTKIGDTVHAWFDCDGTISGAAGIIVFTGLPYASISTVEAVGQFMFDNLNVDGTRTNFVLYLGGNSTEMNIFESKDDASWTQVSISNEAIGIRGQITYKTA